MRQANAERIRFIQEPEALEIDLAGLRFDSVYAVNLFYDDLERRLAPTGRRWRFLVHYADCAIGPQAWSAFAYRGKRLNLAWSLGSVRYGAPRETRAEISRAAELEQFDANLCADRDSALLRLEQMRAESAAAAPPPPDPRPAADESFAGRVTPHPDLRVLELDFSRVSFYDAALVNACFDEIDRRLAENDARWWFVVNFEGCVIYPEAWAAFSHRNRRVTAAYALGSVRFDPSLAPAPAKRRRGDPPPDPNLCASREAALARVAELRRASGA